jgi:hypothetical protein
MVLIPIVGSLCLAITGIIVLPTATVLGWVDSPPGGVLFFIGLACHIGIAVLLTRLRVLDAKKHETPPMSIWLALFSSFIMTVLGALMIGLISALCFVWKSNGTPGGT